MLDVILSLSTYSGGIFLQISNKSTNSLTGICSSVMIKSQAEIVAHDTIKHKDKTEPYTAKTIRTKERKWPNEEA